MGRLATGEWAGFAARILAVLIVSSGMACAKKPSAIDRWEAVEALMPGTEVSVSPGSRGGPDLCRVSAVDESALTCMAEDGQSVGRLLFPRNSVRDVWVFEKAPSRHIVLWIAVAVTAGLEITSCVVAGAGGAAIVGFVLVTYWGAAAIPAALGPVWGLPPSKPPRMRKRLVYESPATP